MSTPGFYEQQALMLSAWEKIRIGQELQIDGYEQLRRLTKDSPLVNAKQLAEGIKGMIDGVDLTQNSIKQAIEAIRQADHA